MSVINQIMAICDDCRDPDKYRHYLEQLNEVQLRYRLEDLQESEAKHAGRWTYPRREVQPITQGTRELTPA